MKNCYICNKKSDKFYIWATPDGKKYKVCGRCINLAKAFKNATVDNSETEEKETN